MCLLFISDSLSRNRSTKGSLQYSKSEVDSSLSQEQFSRQMVSKPKSMFTGTGLAIKNEDEPRFNPKGSAKSFIKKVLEKNDF